MGNQREIRQISPTHRLGVAIRILDDCESIVSTFVNEREPGHFYTYIARANEGGRIYNMDGDGIDLGILRHPTFIIQSGGKMWCGYDAFHDHIATVAEYLADAAFLVGDENDYIDEYRITNRSLYYQRVHSGYWMPIDAYIRIHHPQLSLPKCGG
jgi:hypothetical protein